MFFLILYVACNTFIWTGMWTFLDFCFQKMHIPIYLLISQKSLLKPPNMIDSGLRFFFSFLPLRQFLYQIFGLCFCPSPTWYCFLSNCECFPVKGETRRERISRDMKLVWCNIIEDVEFQHVVLMWLWLGISSKWIKKCSVLWTYGSIINVSN